MFAWCFPGAKFLKRTDPAFQEEMVGDPVNWQVAWAKGKDSVVWKRMSTSSFWPPPSRSATETVSMIVSIPTVNRVGLSVVPEGPEAWIHPTRRGDAG